MQLRKHIDFEVAVEVIRFSECKLVNTNSGIQDELSGRWRPSEGPAHKPTPSTAAPPFVASWPSRRSATSHQDCIVAR